MAEYEKVQEKRFSAGEKMIFRLLLRQDIFIFADTPSVLKFFNLFHFQHPAHSLSSYEYWKTGKKMFGTCFWTGKDTMVVAEKEKRRRVFERGLLNYTWQSDLNCDRNIDKLQLPLAFHGKCFQLKSNSIS